MIMEIYFGNLINAVSIRFFGFFIFPQKKIPKTLVFGDQINHLINLL